MLWINRPYETFTFCEVWDTPLKFSNDFIANGAVLYPETPDPADLYYIYYLLVSKYGNNPIANSDVNQFKLKIYAIISANALTLFRKIRLQTSLRDLSETELITGAKQIYNHALNPNSDPSTSSLEELTYINDQNTANHKKAKMDAYAQLWSLLHADPVDEFLNKFKKCFAVFVDKMPAPFYITDKDYIDN